MSKKLMRLAVALLLVVGFTVGTAHAAPWSFGRAEPASLGGLWGWLVSVWAEGTSMDPNGVTTGDEGTSMDPNGVTTGDEGTSMDPNG